MPESVTCETDSIDALRCRQLQQRLEHLLNERIEPVSLMMLASLPEHPCCFRPIRSEQGISISLLEHSNTAGANDRQCDTIPELSAAVAALETFCAHHRPAGGIEKLVVRLRKIICQLVARPMPYLLQKKLLWMATCLCWQLWFRVRVSADFHQARLYVLSSLLHEPQQRVVTLLRQHQFYLQWNYARRLRHLRHDRANDYSVCWPEKDSYLAMHRCCADSRVLVTIHMGDFFGAFKHIADALDDARAVISLRREGDTDALKRLSARHAGSHQVFMHGKENAWQIVRRLRSGKQTLAVLFDLTADFGETTTVTFFGHQAQFVRGPAELAILGRARIYPFVCFDEAGKNVIRMEPALLPDIRSDETLQDAVARVTQRLVSMAERWIGKHPAQWKYLDRLPSYLVVDHAQHATGMSGGGSKHHAQ